MNQRPEGIGNEFGGSKCRQSVSDIHAKLSGWEGQRPHVPCIKLDTAVIVSHLTASSKLTVLSQVAFNGRVRNRVWKATRSSALLCNDDLLAMMQIAFHVFTISCAPYVTTVLPSQDNSFTGIG